MFYRVDYGRDGLWACMCVCETRVEAERAAVEIERRTNGSYSSRVVEVTSVYE